MRSSLINSPIQANHCRGFSTSDDGSTTLLEFSGFLYPSFPCQASIWLAHRALPPAKCLSRAQGPFSYLDRWCLTVPFLASFNQCGLQYLDGLIAGGLVNHLTVFPSATIACHLAKLTASGSSGTCPWSEGPTIAVCSRLASMKGQR